VGEKKGEKKKGKKKKVKKKKKEEKKLQHRLKAFIAWEIGLSSLRTLQWLVS
jgi:hypothetical protein